MKNLNIIITLVISISFFNCSKNDDNEDKLLSKQNRLALIGNWKVAYYTIGDNTNRLNFNSCDMQWNQIEFLDNQSNTYKETLGVQAFNNPCFSDISQGSFDVNEQRLTLETSYWPFFSGAYERKFNIVSVSTDSLKIRLITTNDFNVETINQKTFVYSKLD